MHPGNAQIKAARKRQGPQAQVAQGLPARGRERACPLALGNALDPHEQWIQSGAYVAAHTPLGA